jgi:hypothetical protein
LSDYGLEEMGDIASDYYTLMEDGSKCSKEVEDGMEKAAECIAMRQRLRVP